MNDVQEMLRSGEINSVYDLLVLTAIQRLSTAKWIAVGKLDASLAQMEKLPFAEPDETRYEGLLNTISQIQEMTDEQAQKNADADYEHWQQEHSRYLRLVEEKNAVNRLLETIQSWEVVPQMYEERTTFFSQDDIKADAEYLLRERLKELELHRTTAIVNGYGFTPKPITGEQWKDHTLMELREVAEKERERLNRIKRRQEEIQAWFNGLKKALREVDADECGTQEGENSERIYD